MLCQMLCDGRNDGVRLVSMPVVICNLENNALLKKPETAPPLKSSGLPTRHTLIPISFLQSTALNDQTKCKLSTYTTMSTTFK